MLFRRPSNPRSSDPQPSSSNGTNTTSANREQSRIQSADFTEENINYNILHEVTRNMPPVSSQPQTSSSTRSMKAAYLNRLQNVLEIFIDQTLHSWERCDTNCFLPISAVGNPRNNAQRNFLDNLILPEENEANSSSSNTNEANISSSNTNQPQTSSNPLQRNSRINFNRNPTPNTTESNQNSDGNASLESRNLTDIHSMLRNSGDILINSIRTLRCFNNRLRIYRNRIRGNSSESQAEPETTSNNETFDRERIDEYINQRNANNPSNRNSEQPEQLSTSRDSGNIEMSDGNSESERLNVIDNRLGNSDDVSMDSSTTSFKERLNVMQNDRIEEPIFDTSNPPNDNMNVGPSDNLSSEPSDSNIPQCSENTTNESDTKTTGSTVPENSSQNLPSCSREGTSDNSTHQAPDGDKNVPSTSGYRSSSVRNNRRIPKVHSINIVTDAFNRVVRGVNLIVTRNQELLNLWTRVLSTRSDPSMSSVRNIWEGLRNDIVQLQINVTQRQLPNNVLPTPARNNACDGNTSNAPTRSDGSNNDTSVRHKRTLSNISKNKSTQSSYSRMHPSNKKIGKRRTKSASSILSQSLNTSNRNLNNPSTSQTNRLLSLNENVSTASTSIEARPFKIKESPTRRSNGPFRRVLRPQLNTQRRGPLSRRAELEVTRDLIRIRARRIVTTMFDIMMYCLDSNQLHNQLVILVKTLKKALTVTCLLLMVNLFSTESPTQSSARNNNAAQDSNSSQPNASIPNRRSNNIPNNNVPNQTRDNANNPVNGSNNSSTLRRESGSSAHIRRIRNHPTFYVRRRMSLPSRNIQQLLSDNNSSQPISPNSLSRPSTSREQEFDPSEGTEPPSDSSRNTSSTPRPQPTRTRLMQTLRPNLFRSHLSRPCFFRRLLCSQGFLNDTLRQANQPVRLEPNSRESTGLRTLLSRLYNSSRRVRGGNPEDRAANNVSVPVVQVNDVPIDMQNADPPHAVYAARVFDHRQPEVLTFLYYRF